MPQIAVRDTRSAGSHICHLHVKRGSSGSANGRLRRRYGERPVSLRHPVRIASNEAGHWCKWIERKAWKETCPNAPAAKAASACPKAKIEQINAHLDAYVSNRSATNGADDVYLGAEEISFALAQMLIFNEM